MLSIGSNRGFQSNPITGRLSLKRYTKAANTNPVTPSHTPAMLRLAIMAAKPMTARVRITKFQNGGRAKNMPQYDVNDPFPGSPLYFMSVM